MDTLAIKQPRQIGLYVRRAREAQGMTREQLAERSGVSLRSLASLELGDASGIRLDKLLAVYQALGLSLLTKGESISKDHAILGRPYPQAAGQAEGAMSAHSSMATKLGSNAATANAAAATTVSIASSKTPKQPPVRTSYNQALNGFVHANTNVELAAPLEFVKNSW